MDTLADSDHIHQLVVTATLDPRLLLVQHKLLCYFRFDYLTPFAHVYTRYLFCACLAKVFIIVFLGSKVEGGC